MVACNDRPTVVCVVIRSPLHDRNKSRSIRSRLNISCHIQADLDVVSRADNHTWYKTQESTQCFLTVRFKADVELAVNLAAFEHVSRRHIKNGLLSPSRKTRQRHRQHKNYKPNTA